MAHLGSGCVGEGYGDNLAGRIDLGQQTKKPPRKQVGFARAGRGLHQDRAGRVESLFALRLVGRSRLDRWLTHR